jgi:hypothetical protein
MKPSAKIVVLTSSKKNIPFIIDADDYDRVSRLCWHHKDRTKLHLRANVKRSDGSFKMVYLHRLIVGARPNEIVDHINGNPLDNRKCNLRIVDSATNSAGARKVNSNNKAGIRGVHQTKHNTFAVRYMNKSYGTFKNIADAYKRWIEVVSLVNPILAKTLKEDQ